MAATPIKTRFCSLRLLATLGLLLFGPVCAAPQSASVRVTASGEYVLTDHQRTGCADDTWSHEERSQYGGAVEGRFESSLGLSAEAGLALGASTLEAYEAEGVDGAPPKRFAIFGGRLLAGYDFRDFGSDIGFVVVGTAVDAIILPSFAVRLGSLGFVWAEGSVIDGNPMSPRIYDLGLSLELDFVELHLGFGQALRWVLENDELIVAEGADSGLYLDLYLGPFSSFGVFVSADLIEELPGGRFGLFWQPTWEAEQPPSEPYRPNR